MASKDTQHHPKAALPANAPFFNFTPSDRTFGKPAALLLLVSDNQTMLFSAWRQPHAEPSKLHSYLSEALDDGYRGFWPPGAINTGDLAGRQQSLTAQTA